MPRWGPPLGRRVGEGGEALGFGPLGGGLCFYASLDREVLSRTGRNMEKYGMGQALQGLPLGTGG